MKPGEAKTQADKTFMFTAEQFTEHFSPSDLGASYSIWIPWDAADGMQKEITLIPTFKGKDGVILQGEPAKLVLPGRRPEDPFASAALQHVSIQQSQTATNMGPLPQLSGLKTTTIAMPSSSHRGSRDSSNAINMGTSTPAQSNIAYATAPQSARAAALYDAMLAQRNQQYSLGNTGTTVAQQVSTPVAGMPVGAQTIAYPAAGNAVPAFPSSMPNMLQAQTMAGQVPSGMPVNAGYALPAMVSPNNVLPGAIPGTLLALPQRRNAPRRTKLEYAYDADAWYAADRSANGNTADDASAEFWYAANSRCCQPYVADSTRSCASRFCDSPRCTSTWQPFGQSPIAVLRFSLRGSTRRRFQTASVRLRH